MNVLLGLSGNMKIKSSPQATRVQSQPYWDITRKNNYVWNSNYLCGYKFVITRWLCVFNIQNDLKKMIGSLPKLISLLMVLLLVGSTFVGGIIYFLRWVMTMFIS